MSRSFKIAGGFAGASAALVGTGMVGGTSAHGALVNSGPVNLSVTNSNALGLYLNMVTGATAGSGSALPGYDFNPWGPSFINFFSTTANATPTNRGVVSDITGNIALNLAPGTVISGTSLYNTGNASGATSFPAGTTGYVGVRLFNEGTAAVNYGYAHISVPATAGPYTILDYAYENTGAAVTIPGVPEPTSLGLLAIGAVGLLKRRNKVA